MVLPARQSVAAVNSSDVCHASGGVSDCTWSEQQTVSAATFTEACNTIIDSSFRSKPRRGKNRETASSTAVAVGSTS